MNPDEADIAAANAGDARAFERLYFRHRDWAYHMSRRYRINHEDALDVVQETFSYILSKIPDLRLTASFRTFLYPVVKHVALRIREKSRRLTSYFSSDFGPLRKY